MCGYVCIYIHTYTYQGKALISLGLFLDSYLYSFSGSKPKETAGEGYSA